MLWQAPHRWPYWKDQPYYLRRCSSEGLDPFEYSTDEVRPHQFGAIYGEQFLYQDLKKQFPSTSIFKMESNQNSAALAQQIQALAATVKELARQNQEMKLWLQQEENRSKGNPEDERDS